MKIAINNTIDGLDGEPMSFKHGEKDVTLTFKKVTTDALSAMFQDEQNLSGEEKIKRALLAQKIYSAQDVVDLELSDVELIKKLVNRLYGTIPYFRVHEMFEKAASSS